MASPAGTIYALVYRPSGTKTREGKTDSGGCHHRLKDLSSLQLSNTGNGINPGAKL